MFEAYETQRGAIDAHRAWMGKRTSYHPSEVPSVFEHAGKLHAIGLVDNATRTAVELFEWYANPPQKYFAYVRETEGGAPWQLTTWTGEVIGRITRGRTWRDNLGGKRVAIWVQGTNGRQYWGTYYSSAGDYARITETIDSQRDNANKARGNYG